MTTNPQKLKVVTTWEAQHLTGIPAATLVAWIEIGHLKANTVPKGERLVFTFTMLDLQLLLLTEKAGKHQRQVAKVPIGDLDIDPGYQLRIATRLAVVGEYSRMIQNGQALPPVLAIRLQGGEGERRLVPVDGYHRVHAHAVAGSKTIDVHIIEACGEPEAFALALRANSDHGLPRSEGDKRKVVLAMLARAEYASLSSRELQELCGVSHMTVCRYRRRLAGRGQSISKSDAAKPDAGTPSWMAEQLTRLTNMLRVTHPVVADAIAAEIVKIA